VAGQEVGLQPAFLRPLLFAVGVLKKVLACGLKKQQSVYRGLPRLFDRKIQPRSFILLTKTSKETA
jgi:hypothetical protein